MVSLMMFFRFPIPCFTCGAHGQPKIGWRGDHFLPTAQQRMISRPLHY
jgi:hypothetical protein